MPSHTFFFPHYLRLFPKHPMIHDISIHLLGIMAINKRGIQSFESSHLIGYNNPINSIPNARYNFSLNGTLNMSNK